MWWRLCRYVFLIFLVQSSRRLLHIVQEIAEVSSMATCQQRASFASFCSLCCSSCCCITCLQKIDPHWFNGPPERQAMPVLSFNLWGLRPSMIPLWGGPHLALFDNYWLQLSVQSNQTLAIACLWLGNDKHDCGFMPFFGAEIDLQGWANETVNMYWEHTICQNQFRLKSKGPVATITCSLGACPWVVFFSPPARWGLLDFMSDARLLAIVLLLLLLLLLLLAFLAGPHLPALDCSDRRWTSSASAGSQW